MLKIFQILLDISMIFGPVVGYLHQYRLISITQTVGSFSIDICGILLFANILRLNFYIFNHYQISLFFQSIVMITVQVILYIIITYYYEQNQVMLINICTKHSIKKQTQKKYQPKDDIIIKNSSTQQSQIFSSQQKFWRWKYFKSYVITIVIFCWFSFVLSIIMYYYQLNTYGVILGIIALLSQSILILPQILKNYFQKTTGGLSNILVILNLSGDIFKLIYFIIKKQPFQFIMCGIIQVCLDTFVILQIFYYKRLETKKFEKQNKSLIIQNKNDVFKHHTKTVTEQNLKQHMNIQMNHIEDLSSPNDQSTDVYGNSMDEEEGENGKNQEKVEGIQIIDQIKKLKMAEIRISEDLTEEDYKDQNHKKNTNINKDQQEDDQLDQNQWIQAHGQQNPQNQNNYQLHQLDSDRQMSTFTQGFKNNKKRKLQQQTNNNNNQNNNNNKSFSSNSTQIFSKQLSSQHLKKSKSNIQKQYQNKKK